jgi:hypothetical protein
VVNSLKAFDVRKHLLMCRSMRKDIVSIKMDHDNDFREFIETFNIVSIIETSKGKMVLMAVNDLLKKYHLLDTKDRDEAIIMIKKVLNEVNKIDTYRFIEY